MTNSHVLEDVFSITLNFLTKHEKSLDKKSK